MYLYIYVFTYIYSFWANLYSCLPCLFVGQAEEAGREGNQEREEEGEEAREERVEKGQEERQEKPQKPQGEEEPQGEEAPPGARLEIRGCTRSQRLGLCVCFFFRGWGCVCVFFLYISHVIQLTPQEQSAEPKYIAALTVARRPKEASREKTRAAVFFFLSIDTKKRDQKSHKSHKEKKSHKERD